MTPHIPRFIHWLQATQIGWGWGPGITWMEHFAPYVRIRNSSSRGDEKWAGGQGGQQFVEFAPWDMASCDRIEFTAAPWGYAVLKVAEGCHHLELLSTVTFVIGLPYTGVASPGNRLYLNVESGFRKPEIPPYLLLDPTGTTATEDGVGIDNWIHYGSPNLDKINICVRCKDASLICSVIKMRHIHMPGVLPPFCLIQWNKYGSAYFTLYVAFHILWWGVILWYNERTLGVLISRCTMYPTHSYAELFYDITKYSVIAYLILQIDSHTACNTVSLILNARIREAIVLAKGGKPSMI